MQLTSASLGKTNIVHRASNARQARPCFNSTPRRAIVTRAQDGQGSPFESFINNVTVAIQNSPIAEGKKALAKLQAGNYDAPATNKKIDDLIANNKVMMFSFSSCPFCKKAKKILEDNKVAYKAIELNEMGQEGMALRAELATRTGRTSMPNIWIAGQGIGGCNDGPGIATLEKEGKLIPMLQEAGAL